MTSTPVIRCGRQGDPRTDPAGIRVPATCRRITQAGKAAESNDYYALEVFLSAMPV